MGYSFSIEVEKHAHGNYYIWISGTLNDQPIPKTIIHDETSKTRAEGVRNFVINNGYIAKTILEKVAKHISPSKRYYLNEYELNRAYGGPEEGGWWYDTGRFVRTIGVHENQEDAETQMEIYSGPYLRRRREDRYEPSSMSCNGWPTLRIEEQPGADFPVVPPQYS